jgi:ABC-type uncharacterized transport system involved in gliding motility auxiliary subunit
LEGNSNWETHILVEGAARGWVSEQTSGKVRFDKNRDVPGPVELALALQRDINGHEQRIVIVGSGGMLANAYSGNGGNLDLGMNMVNWLANEERLITLQPHAAKDAKLTLSKHQLNFLSLTFLIALPLLLIAAGIWSWRRRHR